MERKNTKVGAENNKAASRWTGLSPPGAPPPLKRGGSGGSSSSTGMGLSSLPTNQKYVKRRTQAQRMQQKYPTGLFLVLFAFLVIGTGLLILNNDDDEAEKRLRRKRQQGKTKTDLLHNRQDLPPPIPPSRAARNAGPMPPRPPPYDKGYLNDHYGNGMGGGFDEGGQNTVVGYAGDGSDANTPTPHGFGGHHTDDGDADGGGVNGGGDAGTNSRVHKRPLSPQEQRQYQQDQQQRRYPNQNQQGRDFYEPNNREGYVNDPRRVVNKRPLSPEEHQHYQQQQQQNYDQGGQGPERDYNNYDPNNNGQQQQYDHDMHQYQQQQQQRNQQQQQQRYQNHDPGQGPPPPRGGGDGGAGGMYNPQDDGQQYHQQADNGRY